MIDKKKMLTLTFIAVGLVAIIGLAAIAGKDKTTTLWIPKPFVTVTVERPELIPIIGTNDVGDYCWGMRSDGVVVWRKE